MRGALSGKRYRSLIADMEEDEEYGEVTHPIGSTFTVEDALHVERCMGEPAHGKRGHVCGQMYEVRWDTAVTEDGITVNGEGMWTIWSADEIARDATEVRE